MSMTLDDYSFSLDNPIHFEGFLGCEPMRKGAGNLRVSVEAGHNHDRMVRCIVSLFHIRLFASCLACLEFRAARWEPLAAAARACCEAFCCGAWFLRVCGV